MRTDRFASWACPVLCSAAILAAQQAPGPPPVPPPPAAGASILEPVLLALYLDRALLADTLEALPLEPHGVLVPLGEICRLLGFGIQVDAAHGRASGFFITDKRRFSLDLAALSVRSEDRPFSFRPDQVVVQGQELYVDAQLLQAWFPMDVKVDLRMAELTLTSREKLPVQTQMERDQQLGGLGQGAGADSELARTGEFRPTPYALLGAPFMDLSTTWSKVQFGGSPPPLGSLAAAGDLLGMDAVGSGQRTSDGAYSNGSLTLSREDPHRGLLGPMHASQVAMGTILEPDSIPLLGSLPQGTGAMVDSFPLEYRSKFGTRTFRGVLLDGWSVEFFQNDALLAYQRSRPDGLYEFRDMAMRFGLNQFRLVFHGPQGQVREETLRIDIASDQPAAGEFHYRLLGLSPSGQAYSNLATDQVAPPQSTRGPAYLAESQYGLTSLLALNGSLSRVALPTGAHAYAMAGVSSLFSHFGLQVSAAEDHQPSGGNGQATEAVVRTGLGYSSLSVRRAQYRSGFEYFDQFNGSTDTLDRSSETELNLSSTFKLGSLPLSGVLSRLQDIFVAGGGSNQDRAQFSTSVHDLFLSETLTRTEDTTQTGPTPLTSTLIAYRRQGNSGLQAELGFTRTGGQTSLSDWGLLLDTRSATGIAYQGGVQGDDSRLRDVQYTGSATQMTGSFGYGLTGTYSASGGYSVGFTFQVSFGREPRTGHWVHDAQALSSAGAVSAAAFLDTDGTGRRAPGQPSLPGVQFKLNNAPMESRLKDPALAFKTGLAPNQEVLVQVDDNSLPEAAQQASNKGYRILPRPGKVVQLDLPVGYYGDILGTTRIHQDGPTREYGGLEIELLKADGTRVRRLRTAFDGFFEFQNLPMGDYVLQVTPEEAARLQLQPPPPRRFHVDTVKNLFEGSDLTVVPLPPPDGAGAAPLQTQGSPP
jgi:hypothetical protein